MDDDKSFLQCSIKMAPMLTVSDSSRCLSGPKNATVKTTTGYTTGYNWLYNCSITTKSMCKGCR